jgi:predicted phosphodiesterase
MLAAVASADHYIDANGHPHLRVNRDGSFKIMQLTDLHFAEDKDRNAETAITIKDWAAKEKPDLIAITGDLISGFYWDREQHITEFWGHYHAMFVFMINELQIPWAFVPGDHDFEADADQDKMMLLEDMDQLSASRHNDWKHFGVNMYHQFTYSVPIESYTDPSVVMARAWFFGTGRATCLGRPGKDCIRRDQIEWYKHESRKDPETNIYRKNGIAFMHHPLQEHLQMVNNYPVHGQKRDRSGCQAINTGLYAEFKQKGNI